MADALRETARTADECFRWGGDEFVLLLPDTSGEDAQLVAKRVSKAVEGACTTSDEQPIRMTCGAAELRDEHAGPDLLHAADRELIALKRRLGGWVSSAGLTRDHAAGWG